VAGRQKTCSDEACRRKRKAKAQASWSRRNPEYWTARRLREQAERLEAERKPDRLPPPPRELSRLPVDFVQDAMGAKALVILAFLARILHRSAQDEMRAHVLEISEEIGRIQARLAQDEMAEARAGP